MDLKAKIFIAGHRGLAGSALTKLLETRGHSNIIKRSHAQMDLTDQPAVEAFFKTEKPEYVFLAAAKGGGIMAKKTYPADFVASNLAVQNNVIETAHAMMAMISALSNIQTTWQASVITKNAVFFRTEITCLFLP